MERATRWSHRAGQYAAGYRDLNLPVLCNGACAAGHEASCHGRGTGTGQTPRARQNSPGPNAEVTLPACPYTYEVDNMSHERADWEGAVRCMPKLEEVEISGDEVVWPFLDVMRIPVEGQIRAFPNLQVMVL